MLVHNINLISIICKISSSLNSVLVSWDKKSRTFKLPSSNSPNQDDSAKKSKSLQKRCSLHSTALCLVILQCIFRQDTAVTTKAQEVIAVGILQCLTSHLHTCRLKVTELVLYFNGMFQFHDTYGPLTTNTKEVKTFTGRLNLLFAQVFTITGLTFPTAVTILHLMDPCRASLPLYWLLEECSPCHLEYIWVKVIRIFVFVFNHWLWQFGVNASVFVNGAVTALATMELKKDIAM